MVFVLDAFLDFVMFAVVCVRRGPNVDLTVGKTVDTQGFRHPGKKKPIFMKTIWNRESQNLLHTLPKALLV